MTRAADEEDAPSRSSVSASLRTAAAAAATTAVGDSGIVELQLHSAETCRRLDHSKCNATRKPHLTSNVGL